MITAPTTYTIEDFQRHPAIAAGGAILKGDYIIREFQAGELAECLQATETPVRFEGLMLTFVRRGKIHIGFKDQEFTATDGSIFAIPPHISARIISPATRETELTIAYLSREFLQILNFSISAFSGPVVLEHSSPICRATPEDAEMLDMYFSLLARTARRSIYPRLTRHCASNLCVAMLYHCIEMFMRQLEVSLPSGTETNQKTRNTHVRDFIRLVHANFSRERSVSFYASALCVSPKYLSSMVKEATGRTAARWIDDYVIMEAKNLLRYSGKNVQQVAYTLNFPNQSAFGKYFKHITGMSPTEFQKN